METRRRQIIGQVAMCNKRPLVGSLRYKSFLRDRKACAERHEETKMSVLLAGVYVQLFILR